jgi:hypothetical protein
VGRRKKEKGAKVGTGRKETRKGGKKERREEEK